jgi:hypothetical protein
MRDRHEHATEEALEMYSLETLPEADTEVLEEHLLVCPECQERLTEVDIYVRHMKAAAAKLRAESPRRKAAGFPGSFPGSLVWPAPVWVAVVVVCLLGLAWAVIGRRALSPDQSPPIAVALQVVRGVDDASNSGVPEGHPLRLEADLAGLPSEELVAMELVDAGGRPSHRSEVRPEGERAVLLIPSGLSQGTYWVRLYKTGPRKELLREYALRIQ